MKNLIYLSLILLLAIACNSKTAKSEPTSDGAITKTDTAAVGQVDNSDDAKSETKQLYACPMHPEVQGKKGEKCSKCGMELTDKIKS